MDSMDNFRGVALGWGILSLHWAQSPCLIAVTLPWSYSSPVWRRY
jgi:hypothetical protein